jgi:hypothetical protein
MAGQVCQERLEAVHGKTIGVSWIFGGQRIRQGIILATQCLAEGGSKHLGVDRAAGNGNDRWPYFSDASCVESDPGGLFVIEYVSSTP